MSDVKSEAKSEARVLLLLVSKKNPEASHIYRDKYYKDKGKFILQTV